MCPPSWHPDRSTRLCNPQRNGMNEVLRRFLGMYVWLLADGEHIITSHSSRRPDLLNHSLTASPFHFFATATVVSSSVVFLRRSFYRRPSRSNMSSPRATEEERGEESGSRNCSLALFFCFFFHHPPGLAWPGISKCVCTDVNT